MAAATHPVCLLCWLVPWWQHHISAGVSWSRAAGCGLGGRRGAGPADVLLRIMGVAALRGLRAGPQKGIPVSAPGPLTAPALQAGPTPYHACSGWALASCRGNHRLSHSGEHNLKVALGGGGVRGEVSPAEITEEDEDDEGVVEREWEIRLRCCWNSCFKLWPTTPMFSLAFWLILLNEGGSDWDEALLNSEPREPSDIPPAPRVELGPIPSSSLWLFPPCSMWSSWNHINTRDELTNSIVCLCFPLYLSGM